ncbi:MAG: hypothetical protein H6Q90_5496, partial [Deltaproteobacteria bacterium]|nr:hypothetical protein [Deltaproteobacteria bacterium]
MSHHRHALAVLLLALVPVAGAAGGGCGSNSSTSASQLNLDQPVDIAFACYGGLRLTDGRATADPADVVIQSAQPTTACDIRSGEHDSGTPTPVAPGQEDLPLPASPVGQSAWFGLVLQSGPGTVAIARFPTKPASSFSGGEVGVLDADPLTPNNNSISVGENPIAIVTDAVGCHAITANAGSCDLSVLDIGSAVDNDIETPIDVKRLDVTNAAGDKIRSKPAAMAVEPSIDVVGKACPATASGLVYIAYPSCHLVAAVDSATGKIVTGIQYDAAGTPSILADGNVTCPDECDGGGTITSGTRPVTLDLERDPRTDTRRLVIGAENSSSFTVVELDQLTTLPQSSRQIALQDTTSSTNLGISQIVLTPTIGMGGEGGVVNDGTGVGGQFQFVYAITTDNTIRVADILSLDKECDTQVDPRFLRDIRSVKTLSCMPVGDPATPPRRAGVRGPGIELGFNTVPTSIDIIKSETVAGDSRTFETPDRLVGYFGIVTSANGRTFIINVDDDDHSDLFKSTDPLQTPIPLAIAHQLRDAVPGRDRLNTSTVDMVTSTLCEISGPPDSGGDLIGGPRATTPPSRNIPNGAFAPEKATMLPNLRQVKCTGSDSTRAVSELSFAASEAVRDEVFPDLKGLSGDETWTMTWEGSLSIDKQDSAVDGPQIRESQIVVDGNGMRLVDQTRPYCDAGVEPFDVVQMRGCDPSIGNAECPIGYRCFIHPNSQVQGLGSCLLEDEADRLADACKDYLTTVRRYTVGRTQSGELQLLPRRNTLRTTPVDGCVDDTQCKLLADYAITNLTPQNPADDTSAPDTHTWKCEADPSRAAIGTGKRCDLKCNTTSDCLTGTVCQGAVAGADMSGYCMEGVVPPQACVNAPERYELRAGEAFAVVGTRSGYVHSIIEDVGGTCKRDPAADPRLTGRIPLVAPPCDPTADPISGRLPSGLFEPNPCSLTVTNTDVSPIYLPNTCTLQANPASELVDRPDAPAIKFRNRGMNLTLVDP